MSPDLLAFMERPQSRPAFVPHGVLRGHPLAELIPQMSEDEYTKLKDDIAQRGVMVPVVLYEGQILDGRHRYRACREVGRGVDFTEYTGDDAAGYVMALNVHRRHLTPSQRAVIALDVEKVYAEKAKENMVEGGRVSQDREPLPSDRVHATRKAAETVGVSHGYVSDAKLIKAEAPELVPQIASGSMTLPEAKRVARRRRPTAPKLVVVGDGDVDDQPDDDDEVVSPHRAVRVDLVLLGERLSLTAHSASNVDLSTTTHDRIPAPERKEMADQLRAQLALAVGRVGKILDALETN